VTSATTSGNPPLTAHVRLIHATADLIEQAGIAGLAIYPEPDEIVIQVPQTSGDAPSRTAKVARLAALTGCQPAADPQPGKTQGWIHAHGTFAGHPVHIFTPLSQEDPTS
jgi:hypothetical protein